jgi:peptidoglycan/xylan/chitin deacetylase (PgdA/CDA1 family)
MADRWPDGCRAAVTLSFDGGYTASVERALPLLAERGMASTWFLVSGSLGGELEGRAVASAETWAGLDPARAEVGNHSRSHPLVRRSVGEIAARAVRSPAAIVRGARRAAARPTAPSAAGGARPAPRLGLDAAAADFAAGKEQLETALGRPVPAFAYPNGRDRTRLVRAVQHMGHRSARTSRPGWNDPDRLEPFALRAQTWTTATSVEEAGEWVDRAVDTNSWLIEVLHLVDDGTDYPWTTTRDDLARHLDALAAAEVWVATQTAVVDRIAARPLGAPGGSNAR